jgi:hypothetical protein
MASTLRSKQGCWTCRLRKKKCDEKHPFCATCESLTITCYGYGPKPDWMDNGVREKAIAKSIKEIVKHSSRRKGRLGLTISRFRDHGNGSKPDSRMLNLAPKSVDADVSRQSSVAAPFNMGPESGSQGSDSPENSNASSGASKSSPVRHSVRLYTLTRLTSCRILSPILLMRLKALGCRLKSRIASRNY